MRVILLRHGVAVDRDDPKCPPDPERPLTREGVEKTRAAARGLHVLGAHPDAVLTSPYVRAFETAKIASEEMRAPGPERVDELLPSADPRAMTSLLAKRSEEEILCAGHEPSLSLLLARLVWGAGGGAEFANLKKAGAACVETSQPGATPGDLLWILPPRILRLLGERS